MTERNRNQGDTSNRGFASMDPEKQREIASEGGKAAHASGRAHEFTSEEAAAAGRKGGKASARKRGNRNNQESNEDEDTYRKH